MPIVRAAVADARAAVEHSAAKEAPKGDTGPAERATAPGHETGFGPLEDWVGFHLRLAQSASFQAFARQASGMDLRPGRFAVLTLIGENPGISQTALSRANGRDKSTLTPALDDLERRGFILRERLASDRRSYALSLTEAGRAVLEELTRCAERHEANINRILGRDRARFMALLKRLSSELQTSGTEGP